MNPRSALAFVLIGLLWGSAWIPTSEVLKQISGFQAGALRFAVAAVFTATLAVIARLLPGKTQARFSVALILDALVLAITSLSLPYALIVWASGHISPAAIPVLFAFMPLIALLIEGEGAGIIPALVIGISGAVLLVAPGLSFSIAQLGGVLLALGAVIFGAFSLIYARQRLRGADILLSSALQLTFAAIFLGLLSYLTERTHPWNLNTASISWLFTLGIAVSGITLPLLYWLLTEIQAWQAALLQWISTLVAVAEAAWFLRARPSGSQAFAAPAILGAVLWLLYRRGPVTSPVTIPAFRRSAASDSEVGSKYR